MPVGMQPECVHCDRPYELEDQAQEGKAARKAPGERGVGGTECRRRPALGHSFVVNAESICARGRVAIVIVLGAGLIISKV